MVRSEIAVVEFMPGMGKSAHGDVAKTTCIVYYVVRDTHTGYCSHAKLRATVNFSRPTQTYPSFFNPHNKAFNQAAMSAFIEPPSLRCGLRNYNGLMEKKSASI